YDELRRGFNALHFWATKRWNEEELLAAVQSLDARSYRAPEIQYEQRFYARCKGCKGLIEWIEDLERPGRWIPMRPARHQRHVC
ncbi:MAG TPA: hypothetical protein VM537_13640, partial [Anaerolineae bacterium]|nr:hypothetical protein [Anaerolineae bacterium]